MSSTAAARVRPLHARPGARYRCFGDGLCCTDIHGLGPLTRSELVQLRRLDRASAAYNHDFEAPMLRTQASGACVFLDDNQRCRVHAEFGPAAKPDGCRRFPLGLVATPRGGRITTEHRCPCRTMGDRPALTITEVEPSLRDNSGRLCADRRVGAKVGIRPRARVPFETYEGLEAEMLARLARGEPPWKVLEAAPFPRLSGTSFKTVAGEFIDSRDGTQFGIALAWFGDAILATLKDRRLVPRARPWKFAFDRAEMRSSEHATVRNVLSDWLSDEIWSMKWAPERSFMHGQGELATRLAIARTIVKALRTAGARPDRAAAEAVSIIDLVGASDYWVDVVARM